MLVFQYESFGQPHNLKGSGNGVSITYKIISVSVTLAWLTIKADHDLTDFNAQHSANRL